MSEKIRVNLTAVYKNGEVLKKDHKVPAKVGVLTIPGAEKFRELQIRMVVDAGNAEELLEGLLKGSVHLNIEQMLTLSERESKS